MLSKSIHSQNLHSAEIIDIYGKPFFFDANVVDYSVMRDVSCLKDWKGEIKEKKRLQFSSSSSELNNFE